MQQTTPFQLKGSYDLHLRMHILETCVETILHHICSKCSGSLEKRPMRPQHVLGKYRVSKKVVYKPIDLGKHQDLLKSKGINN